MSTSRVARELVSSIKDRTLQEDFTASLTPGQQVVRITNEELTAILTAGSHRLESASSRPIVVLMAGLNGSGKTTLAAKLARHLKQDGQTALMGGC